MNALAALCTAVCVWLSAELIRGRGVVETAGSRRPHRLRVGRKLSRQVWLSQAGAAVTPRQFWAASGAVAVATFVLLYLLDQTVAVALMPAAAAGAAPYAYWSSQRRRRADARLQAWPEALRQVIGQLESGAATLHDALEGLGVSGPPALRAPMGRYVRLSARVGYRQALEAVRMELADPISDPVLLTFGMAVEEGTDQVLRILSSLISQIEGDLQLADRIRTVQTQSRIATWAVFGVPYVLLVFLCATQSFYRQFFSEPVGVVVMAVGVSLSLVGLLLARRLGRPIPTAERVFLASESAA
ncbi:MAG TPA: hypothetical protein VNF50_13440 [Acidimicrobiales bacterium]|nr:hypothetical protein [Acidimicrobiales bacterium]